MLRATCPSPIMLICPLAVTFVLTVPETQHSTEKPPWCLSTLQDLIQAVRHVLIYLTSKKQKPWSQTETMSFICVSPPLTPVFEGNASCCLCGTEWTSLWGDELAGPKLKCFYLRHFHSALLSVLLGHTVGAKGKEIQKSKIFPWSTKKALSK